MLLSILTLLFSTIEHFSIDIPGILGFFSYNFMEPVNQSLKTVVHVRTHVTLVFGLPVRSNLL